MRARLWALLVLASCTKVTLPAVSAVASFQVDLKGIYHYDETGNRVSLEVVSPCEKKYGGQATVPPAEKGTFACPYIIPRTEIEIETVATAIGQDGTQAAGFAGSVSFRVVPGDLTGDYSNRWAPAVSGVATATVKAAHQYGQVRIWAEDAPPQYIYSDGGLGGTQSQLPPEPVPPLKRSYATGLSPTVFFAEPTLQSVQVPDGFDNRSSPLVGEFLTIGRRPEAGGALLQSCADDPARDGKKVAMVVTGIDPSGFFVTDVSACRLVEVLKDGTGTTQVRVAEPPERCLAGGAPIEQTDAGTGLCEISQTSCTRGGPECHSYSPATFASMFIYNYSFPDGLDQGDLLWTLAGSVQEFTSTTQLTFPSWSIAEKVRQLPPDQWDKWLKLAPPTPILARTCGSDNQPNPFLTDSLCGHNKRNLKMESMESGLVSLKRVRMPQVFKNCDNNADGTVPFFCEQKPSGVWFWGSCAFNPDGTTSETPADQAERSCNQDCVVGMNDYADSICSEESTYAGFGQYVVEMAPPGLASAGLDDSLPAKITLVPLTVDTTGMPAWATLPLADGSPYTVACSVAVKVHFGDTLVDTDLPANTPLWHTLADNEAAVWFLPVAVPPAGAQCSVALNPRVRINLITKDAVPELQPDCSESDPNADRATQCQNLHAATFDVVGHLRHVQPARPRWSVTPRDPDDVCCHPGAGLQCPFPIKPCP